MKHMIQFKIQGLLRNPTIEYELESKERKLPEKLPEKVIAYRFFCEFEDICMRGNYTGWTYFGQEYSFLELCDLFKKTQELLPKEPEPKKESIFEEEEEEELEECSSFRYLTFMRKNMERYGWRRAVRACDGHWYPLEKEDDVVFPLKRGGTK